MYTTIQGARQFSKETATQARIKTRIHRWWHSNFCEYCKVRASLGSLSGGILAVLQQSQDEEATMTGGPHGSAH